MSTRQPSSAWVAMGAAVGGVLLGGAAVYLGLHGGFDRSLPGVLGADAGLIAAASEPASAAGGSPPAVDGNGLRLVDAVAETRDTVVNLRAGRGLGAGVIVDPGGLVLTNYHVIADVLHAPRSGLLDGVEERRAYAGGVIATFENGRELPATVLFSDPGEDVALLRLQPADTAERFASAKLGRSSELRVGEEVFAIGNPFGLTHTLSRGIVSALDRTDVLQNRTVPVIQLDAAINIGNSGGPLFDLTGELVGIVTAHLLGDGPRVRAEGIAFALPMDHVRAFLRAVTADVDGRSGMVGVDTNPWIDPPPAVQKLGYSAGLVVGRVFQGFPAAQAGMRRGDTIVELRGKRFASHADGLERIKRMQETVRSMFPGEKLPVTVVRDGQVVHLELEIAAATRRHQAIIDTEELFGVVLDPDAEVPTVRGIRDDSALDLHGAEQLRNSRIVHVLGRDIGSLDDLAATMAEVRGLADSGGAPNVPAVFRRRDGRFVRFDLPVRRR